MRILVIGASGLVGSHVIADAESRGHTVLGTYRSFAVPNLVHLDLASEAETRRLLDSFRPDWVVHAAGWTWVDGCETDPERAMRENCEQPVMLAGLCKNYGVRMAYFSTTYVFDGNKGPYAENDEPNPINVYGRSKLLAEKKIQKISSDTALILRIICVWGIEKQQKNFVYQVLRSIKNQQAINIPTDQYGNPTWAGDIATWLNTLLIKNAHGVWNLSGENESCSRAAWYEIIKKQLQEEMPDRFEYNNQARFLTTSDMIQCARRPLNASASNNKRIKNELYASTTPPAVSELAVSLGLDERVAGYKI
jgi:dTDP-4-dehydrorhamnose reductase